MNRTNTGRMPAVFFGHGNPMNALANNQYTQAWRQIGAELPRPKAVLAVSAHWFVPGTMVTAMRAPRTIHDFGGFPPALYDVQYPAPGDPTLAGRVQELLAPTSVRRDEGWGIDHGTWSVFVHVYPDAQIPIVQLSIDETQPPAVHYDIGRRLAPLRDDGVLIVGSGNVVHNLHAYAWGRHSAEPLDWAVRFENRVRDAILTGDDGALVEYEGLGSDAMLSAPTPDHFLPLLYVLGARHAQDAVAFPIDGFDGGSISMLAVKVGH
jgi:4,5-DOPA dioxygenase extradiol